MYRSSLCYIGLTFVSSPSVVMSGMSPSPRGSRGSRSSDESMSYLPKLEAKFMRDFLCCGETFHTLHDLMQHLETVHAQTASLKTPPPPEVNSSQTVSNMTSETACGVVLGDMNKKPFKCDICGKRFKNAYGLKYVS
jgi:hypothetical protein